MQDLGKENILLEKGKYNLLKRKRVQLICQLWNRNFSLFRHNYGLYILLYYTLMYQTVNSLWKWIKRPLISKLRVFVEWTIVVCYLIWSNRRLFLLSPIVCLGGDVGSCRPRFNYPPLYLYLCWMKLDSQCLLLNEEKALNWFIRHCRPCMTENRKNIYRVQPAGKISVKLPLSYIPFILPPNLRLSSISILTEGDIEEGMFIQKCFCQDILLFFIRSKP